MNLLLLHYWNFQIFFSFLFTWKTYWYVKTWRRFDHPPPILWLCDGSRAADDLILQVIIIDFYHLCFNYNTSYIACNPGDEKNLWTFKNYNCKEYAFFSLLNLFFDRNVSFIWAFLFSLGDSSTELLYSFAGTKIKVLLWLLCSLTQICNTWLKNTSFSALNVDVLSYPIHHSHVQLQWE